MSRRTIFFLALLLVLFGVATRLLPHEPNMSAITALALAGSAFLGRRWALMLPLAAMALSDIVIGFYAWPLMLSVYGSFALIAISSWWLQKHRGALHVAGIAALSSTLFFLVTNAAVWAFAPWYEKSVSGLLYAYTLGLPFYRNMLMGDLFYTGAVFVSLTLFVRYQSDIQQFFKHYFLSPAKFF